MKSVAVAMLAAAWPGTALAGAWPPDAGGTQVIVKFERMRAESAFDRTGARRLLPVEREDDTVSVYAEHGLTGRLTLQVRADWQRGRDLFVDYEGGGPSEIGLRFQVFRTDHSTISLYGGYAHAGVGRNAGYAAPGVGEHDWEVRLLAGHGGRLHWLGGREAFVEVQVARRVRDGLADEDRLDLTTGIHFGAEWTLLSQVYAGRTTEGPEVEWINAESSVVRRVGDWSFQVGWREAVSGRGEVPAQRGPVIAVWRRF